MKKYLAVLTVMIFALGMTSMVYAGSKNDAVPVSATVAANCTISGGSIAFGTLDAVTNSGGATATVTQPVIKCTKGASVAVTDDMGANEASSGVAPARMKKSDSSDYIEYAVTYATPLTGTGINSDIGATLTLAATIASGKLDDAPAGSYSDTLTLTVTY